MEAFLLIYLRLHMLQDKVVIDKDFYYLEVKKSLILPCFFLFVIEFASKLTWLSLKIKSVLVFSKLFDLVIPACFSTNFWWGLEAILSGFINPFEILHLALPVVQICSRILDISRSQISNIFSSCLVKSLILATKLLSNTRFLNEFY